MIRAELSSRETPAVGYVTDRVSSRWSLYSRKKLKLIPNVICPQIYPMKAPQFLSDRFISAQRLFNLHPGVFVHSTLYKCLLPGAILGFWRRVAKAKCSVWTLSAKTNTATKLLCGAGWEVCRLWQEAESVTIRSDFSCSEGAYWKTDWFERLCSENPLVVFSTTLSVCLTQTDDVLWVEGHHPFYQPLPASISASILTIAASGCPCGARWGEQIGGIITYNNQRWRLLAFQLETSCACWHSHYCMYGEQVSQWELEPQQQCKTIF